MTQDQFPPWHQGDEHWALQSLQFWFKQPTWAADQATLLITGEDPRRQSDDALNMIDGREIPRRSGDYRERAFDIKVQSAQSTLREAARALGMSIATPNAWITLAESNGITPAWKQLAIDNKLLGVQPAPESALEIDNDLLGVQPTPESVSEPDNLEIPGKLPRVTSGQLAVKAAWEIECETGKRATAKQVVKKLHDWAESGDYPELLKTTAHGVTWATKAGKVNDYDIGACGKTLGTWNKSRA